MDNWKVEITRVGESEAGWAGYFETEQEANEWLDKQKLKPGRREARVEVEPLFDSQGMPLYDEVPAVDAEGNPVFEMDYEYDVDGNVVSETLSDRQVVTSVPRTQEVSYPAEATYDVIDNSAEVAKVERLKQMDKEAAVEAANIAFGQKLIALVGTRNVAKGLTSEQINGMQSDPVLAPILQLLSVGRLGTAKPMIQAYTPDGVLITEQDKQDYLQLLEDHKSRLGL